MDENTTSALPDTTQDSTVAQDAATPAPSLEQLTLEVKFYLGQIGQNIIEVGKRLIAAKEMLPHGEWLPWLENNFNLTVRTADRFMKCAERFGNWTLMSNLKPTQMIAMLALPEAETEQFIEAKAAEGNPVEDMTVKKLREEIKQWKAKAENYAEELSTTQISLDDAQKERDAIARERDNIKQVNSELRAERDAANRAKFAATEKLRAQQFSTVVKVPDDYEATKQEVEKLKQQLAERPIEIEVPADYHTNKLALASAQKELESVQTSLEIAEGSKQRMKEQLDEKDAELKRQTAQRLKAEVYATTAHKADMLAPILGDIIGAHNGTGFLAHYKENCPDTYAEIHNSLKNLLAIMDYDENLK